MKKILIIDDSKTQIFTLKNFFLKNGFDVATSEDALDGYKKIVQYPPDIIVCDVVMPNLNGYQFSRLLKNNILTSKIPIVLLTSLNQNIDRFWSKQAGADLFLSKNCELEDLLANINVMISMHPVPEGIKRTIRNTKSLQNALESKVNTILDTSLMEATIMNEFRKLSKNIENADKFLKSFFYLLSSVFNYNICAIYFYDKDFSEHASVYYSTEEYDYKPEVIAQIINSAMVSDDLPLCKIETNKRPKVLSDNTHFATQYSFDISVNERKLARVCLFSYDKINYEEFEFFDTVKNEIALVAKIRNLYAQTKFLSITDALTSLYNRRHFFDNIEREYARVQRYKSDLSVAMLDIDLFKGINDKYGHQAGDAVLVSLADILVKTLRKTDLVFRYGGEEIVILLPETSLHQAQIPLERIRAFIEKTPVEFNGVKIPYTISIGIADMIASGVTSSDDLVTFADKALYTAKSMGRNKVVLYE